MSGGNDKVVCVWKMEGSELRSRSLLGHTGSVDVVVISSNEMRIVVQSTSVSVPVWERYVSG